MEVMELPDRPIAPAVAPAFRFTVTEAGRIGCTYDHELAFVVKLPQEPLLAFHEPSTELWAKLSRMVEKKTPKVAATWR
jgi:hypothetical protein